MSAQRSAPDDAISTTGRRIQARNLLSSQSQPSSQPQHTTLANPTMRFATLAAFLAVVGTTLALPAVGPVDGPDAACGGGANCCNEYICR
jgi:hypothetical protein